MGNKQARFGDDFSLYCAKPNVDLLELGGEPWLLVPAFPKLIDALAEFEADMEDRECGGDDEPDCDDEYDHHDRLMVEG